jgi:iron complex outermembrane receptor protein
MVSSKSKLMGIALCSCVLPASGAWAQSDSSGQAPRAQRNAPAPEISNSGIQDIIVTARRTNESAQSVPLAITVLDAQKLADTNVQGIADIAKITPGFFVQTSSADPTGVLLTIRGQSQQDSILTTDSPIGVYVDGVNYIRSSNLESALVDIERVEVLKGPQGTLYGKNTTGGAISITTRQPDLSQVGGYLDVGAGNYARNEQTAVFNLPLIKDELGVRLLAQRQDHGDYGRDGAGRGLGSKNAIAFRGNLLWRPNDTVRLAISADYTRTRSSGPNAYLAFVNPFPALAPGAPNPAPALLAIALGTGILNPALLADPVANQNAIGAALGQARALLASNVSTNPYNSNGTFPQGVYAQTYGVSANLAVDLTPSLQFRSISAARWLSRNEQVDLDGSPYGLLEADLRSNARNLSQEFQFSSQNSRTFNWIVGAYFNEEEGRDGSTAFALRAINPANPNITDGAVKNSSWAVFGQGVVSLTDTLRFTGGLRWTSENKILRSFNRSGPGGATCNIPASLQLGGTCAAKFENTFSDYSYLASLDWKPTEGILLYARTARGFKGGGENLRGTGTAESFSAFAPEVVTDYEVGFKVDFLDRRLRLNGAIYYADYTNIQRTIVQASTSGSIVSLVTNAAKARIQGAELEVTAVPVTGLTLSGSFSLTDAKYKQFVDATGDRSNEPFQFPKYSYTLAATYSLPTSIGDLRAAVDWNWRSDTQLVGSAIYQASLSQPAYGLLGGRLSLNVQSFDADIAVFAKNILDKRYAVSGVQFDNSLGFNSLYVGEPRTFGIQLTKRFGGG